MPDTISHLMTTESNLKTFDLRNEGSVFHDHSVVGLSCPVDEVVTPQTGPHDRTKPMRRGDLIAGLQKRRCADSCRPLRDSEPCAPTTKRSQVSDFDKRSRPLGIFRQNQERLEVPFDNTCVSDPSPLPFYRGLGTIVG